MERMEMESRNQYLEVLRERYLRAKTRKEKGLSFWAEDGLWVTPAGTFKVKEDSKEL